MATDAGDATASGRRNALEAWAGWDAVAGLLFIILVEFSILQAFAVGVTTGLYHLAHLMDVGRPAGFEDWMAIFQVVNPTLALPGGAAIVLSTWILARRARLAEQVSEQQKQEVERQKQEVERQKQEVERQKQEVERQKQEVENQKQASEQRRLEVEQQWQEAERRANAAEANFATAAAEVAAAREQADAASEQAAAAQASIAALQAQLERRPRRRRRQLQP